MLATEASLVWTSGGDFDGDGERDHRTDPSDSDVGDGIRLSDELDSRLGCRGMAPKDSQALALAAVDWRPGEAAPFAEKSSR